MTSTQLLSPSSTAQAPGTSPALPNNSNADSAPANSFAQTLAQAKAAPAAASGSATDTNCASGNTGPVNANSVPGTTQSAKDDSGQATDQVADRVRKSGRTATIAASPAAGTLGAHSPRSASRTDGTTAGKADLTASQSSESAAPPTSRSAGNDSTAKASAASPQDAPAPASDPAQQALAAILAAQSATNATVAGDQHAMAAGAEGQQAAEFSVSGKTAVFPDRTTGSATPAGTGSGLNGTTDPAALALGKGGAESGQVSLSNLRGALSGAALGANAGTTPAASSATADSGPQDAFSALLQTSSTIGNPASMASTASISSPVGSATFGNELAQNMVSLAHRGSQSVELNLNPGNLGPIRVDIQMSGQTASLTLTAAHEATRAALNNALPQLHQMFSQSGLVLGHAQVGDQGAGNDHHASGHQAGKGAQSGPDRGHQGETLATATTTPVIATRVPRLVDTFV